MKHETASDFHTGRPCGNCNETSYQFVSGGYKLGMNSIDGWQCVGCSMVFVNVGIEKNEGKQQSRHQKNLLQSMPKPERFNSVKQPPMLKSGRSNRSRAKINPRALQWLRDHREQLKSAGWTAPELYRRNPSKGIAWLSIWSRENISVTIGNADGWIIFSWTNAQGAEIRQTALPDAIWREQ